MKDNAEGNATHIVVDISVEQCEIFESFKPSIFIEESCHEDVLSPEEKVEEDVSKIVRFGIFGVAH